MKLALKYILVFFMAALCLGGSWTIYLIFDRPYDFRQITLNPASAAEVRSDDTTLSGAVVDAMSQALRNAVPVDGAPVGAESCMTILTHTDGKSIRSYELLLGSILDREGYFYAPRDGAYSRIATADLILLLSDPAFAEVYPSAALSLTARLTAGSTELTGEMTQADYRYLLVNGNYQSVRTLYEAAPAVQEISGADPFRLIFSQQPETVDVSVTRGGISYRTQNGISPEEICIPEEAGAYVYQVTAHYPLSLQRDWYGQVTWEFALSVPVAEVPSQDVPPAAVPGE